MTAYLWTLGAYALQLSALVIVALIVTRMMQLRAPRQALRFWQTILAIALLIPFAQKTGGDSAALGVLFRSTAATAVADATSAVAPRGLDAAAIVLAALLVGLAGRLCWLGLGLLRLRSIVARATTEHSLSLLTAELTQSIGVDADVRVTDAIEGPATVGVRRPLILLPPSVLTMNEAVQRAILCHEMLHVKRRDWMNTIAEEIWCAVLWFHPLARVIASRLSLAREMVVDEATILLTRDRRAYAEALLAFSDPQPHVIGVTPFIGRRTLSQRISLIAQEGSMPHRRAMLYVFVALTASIAITAVAADRFPMFATLQAQSVVYDPGPGITLPVVVTEVKPGYTQEAMQEKIQGSVWLKCVVSENGAVTDVQVSRSLDAKYGLDQAAVEAASEWKFRPGRKDGQPVAVRVTLELTFTLK